MKQHNIKKNKKKHRKQPNSQNPDLHVDPEGPDVEGVDGFPEPGGEVHPIETTPGPREEASREGAVQCHLQHQTGNCTLNKNSCIQK